MNIFLADDQQDVRSALRLLLEQEPGMRIIGEAEAAEGLLAAVSVNAPDLVLLDWELPTKTRGERTATFNSLRALCPNTAVIALSGWPEARQAAGAHRSVQVSIGAVPAAVRVRLLEEGRPRSDHETVHATFTVTMPDWPAGFASAVAFVEIV